MRSSLKEVEMMTRDDLTKKASDLLLGKRIVKVEYMPGDNIKEMGWYSCPIIFQLEDGNWVIPQSDDEGNNGGALFMTNDVYCMPTLRERG